MNSLEDSIGMLVTEQNNSDTFNIDICDTNELVEMINHEDQKVSFAVRKQKRQIAESIDLAASRLREGGRMFYIGAGTSGRLGIVDASECKATYGVPGEMVQAIIPGGRDTIWDASDGDEDDFNEGFRQIEVYGITFKDIVIGITASGRTPFVLGALAGARKTGAATVGICNNPHTPIHEIAQITIAVITGPEVIQGSTRMKAGTAQKMVLNMISTGAMVRIGKTYHNLMVDLLANNEKLRDRAGRIVAQATGAGEEEARSVLRACGYHVKTAIVCILKACKKEEAEIYLDECDGFISQIVK